MSSDRKIYSYTPEMLDSIAIFRNIFNTETMKSFYRLVKFTCPRCGLTGNGDDWEFFALDDDDGIGFVRPYGEFVSNVYRHGGNFSDYLRKIVFEDKNVYITSVAQDIPVTEKMQQALENELELLDAIAAFSSDIYKDGDYTKHLDLPQWDNSPTDFKSEYKERIENVWKYGYGIYSKYFMFIVRDSEIVPVKYPDVIRLTDLIGYKRQRQVIIDNTLALLNGKPAQNVLLTGAAGTGKSSTVKAVANEYRDMGLRIIEVRKDQLREIPMIIDDLSRDPLKFIIFIDDLSFAADDENFGTLKAILEGSVSARADNIVIYATSNRSHIVKERFSDREGDDIHRNDTMQELISLSERFGLHVTFPKPNKAEYFEIVRELAKQKGITWKSQEEMQLEGERFAMEKSGRSARAAKQFVDKMLSEEK